MANEHYAQAIAGRFSCRRSESHESVPELHISGVGKIALPMAQDVQNQLQQMCQRVTYSQPPAEWNPRQAWQLNASLLAVTSSGETMHIRACMCI